MHDNVAIEFDAPIALEVFGRIAEEWHPDPVNINMLDIFTVKHGPIDEKPTVAANMERYGALEDAPNWGIARRSRLFHLRQR